MLIAVLAMGLAAVGVGARPWVGTPAALQGENAGVTLTWVDNADNETGFTIQRATNAAFTANVVNTSVGANMTTYRTGKLPRSTPCYFRVLAYNGAGPPAWANATPFPIVRPGRCLSMTFGSHTGM
jgi:hypothetical protein